MHGLSIENKDKLIEYFYKEIKKIEQKKDLKRLYKSTIAFHKNVISMSNKEF